MYCKNTRILQNSPQKLLPCFIRQVQSYDRGFHLFGDMSVNALTVLASKTPDLCTKASCPRKDLDEVQVCN